VLQPHLTSFAQLSLYHLTTLGPHLNAYYLSTSASAPEPPSDPNPEDGQNAGIVDLGASILDFFVAYWSLEMRALAQATAQVQP